MIRVLWKGLVGLVAFSAVTLAIQLLQPSRADIRIVSATPGTEVTFDGYLLDSHNQTVLEIHGESTPFEATVGACVEGEFFVPTSEGDLRIEVEVRRGGEQTATGYATGRHMQTTITRSQLSFSEPS